jgi:hypothetical protein
MIFKKDRQSDLPVGEYYAREPNVNVRRAIERLLRVVPQDCLEGLGGVILCDTTKFKEHYGDNEEVSAARYIHIRDGSENPWIEICVDWYINGFPRWVLRISAVTDLMLSRPFYHEIGHHIDRMSEKNDEDREKDADRWRKKFQKRYMLRYHFLFCALALVVLLPFRKRLAKMCGYQKSGKT